MQITDERCEEFRAAYKKDFNEEISADEARAMLSRLAELFMLLVRPLPQCVESGCACTKQPS